LESAFIFGLKAKQVSSFRTKSLMTAASSLGADFSPGDVEAAESTDPPGDRRTSLQAGTARASRSNATNRRKEALVRVERPDSAGLAGGLVCFTGI
jgi:hypothetical protein